MPHKMIASVFREEGKGFITSYGILYAKSDRETGVTERKATTFYESSVAGSAAGSTDHPEWGKERQGVTGTLVRKLQQVGYRLF